MKTITIYLRTQAECIEKLNKVQDNINRLTADASKLTHFGRYCLDSDIKIRDEYNEYLKAMREHGKDYIYTCKGKVLDYKLGQMLCAL